MTKDLYKKFLNNRCTPEELKEVTQWLKSGAAEEESKQWGFEFWEAEKYKNADGDDEKLSELFYKIQQKIDSKTAKKDKAIRKKSKLIAWITRAAAILFIPLLAMFLYFISEKNIAPNQYTQLSVDYIEVVSQIGSRTILQLSDGTEVHLNYGSKLKYPQTFTGNTREVILEGEGYFDVAHNPEKPFVVNTGEVLVKALGTEFDVLAYSGDNDIQTTLVEGKVVLEKISQEGQNEKIGSMVPGQHVKYNPRNGNISSSKGNIEKYIAWKDDKMIFEDTPITEVARQLKRKYNVEIKVQDDIKNYDYTVTFFDEPLMQILDLMTIATPISYEVLPRKKLPDGSFSKQVVIIKRKENKS